MPRHQSHFSLFLISFFLLISSVFAPQALAAPITECSDPASAACIFALLTKHKSIQDYGKEFCDKRSGDLMNLETWFSGKCGPEIDTLSGEGVGFADIITLQGIEVLIGPQQKGLIDQMGELFKTLGDIRTILGSNNGQTLDQKLAQVKSITPTNTGLMAQAANLTSTLLLAKPATTSDYIAHISNNLKNHHIIDQAYAATPGYGFTALSPILPLWRAFRNVAYLLFALVFVLYGVMIMLRIKIDSKTAATIQLAIPKLVSTLLMITFSYAIVGLLVDISTVITGLAVNVLAAGHIINLDWFTGATVIPIVGGTTFLGAFGSFLVNTIVALMVAPFIMISFLFAPYAGLTGSVVFVLGAAMGWGFIIGIIIFIAILISYVKIVMKLFSAFLSIIISLIFSPIILLGNVFPGSDAFSKWLVSIYGNLAVFPTAVFMLTLSYALMVQPFFKTIRGLAAFVPAFSQWINGAGFAELIGVEDLSTTGAMWSPPMTFGFGGVQGDIMLAAIGFGLLLMSSKYVDMVRDALKVPPFKYGAAIGDALKMGTQYAPWIGGQPLSGHAAYQTATSALGIKPNTSAPWPTLQNPAPPAGAAGTPGSAGGAGGGNAAP